MEGEAPLVLLYLKGQVNQPDVHATWNTCGDQTFQDDTSCLVHNNAAADIRLAYQIFSGLAKRLTCASRNNHTAISDNFNLRVFAEGPRAKQISRPRSIGSLLVDARIDNKGFLLGYESCWANKLSIPGNLLIRGSTPSANSTRLLSAFVEEQCFRIASQVFTRNDSTTSGEKSHSRSKPSALPSPNPPNRCAK